MSLENFFLGESLTNFNAKLNLLVGNVNSNSSSLLDLANTLNNLINTPTSIDPNSLSSAVPVNKGGTGATTPADARTNLELHIGISAYEITISSAAQWSGTNVFDGVTRYYYLASLSGVTASTRFTMALQESKYTTSSSLEAAKRLWSNIIAVESVSGGIKLYASKNIKAGGVTLYLTCYRMFS